MSEPQFLNDPASIATLTVVRSSRGEGVVHLIWLLQEEGRDDLSPHNGTLIFNGVGMAGKYEYEHHLYLCHRVILAVVKWLYRS